MSLALTYCEEGQHGRSSTAIGVSEGVAERPGEPSTQDIGEGRGIGGALQQRFLVRLRCHGFAGRHKARAHQNAAGSECQVQVPIEKGTEKVALWLADRFSYMHNSDGEGAMQGRTQRFALPLMTHAPRWGVAPATEDPVGLAKRARAILLLAEGRTFAATRHVELRDGMPQMGAASLWLGLDGLCDKKRPGRRPVFPRRWRCMWSSWRERPDVVGRSLSQWDSAELARQLVRDGVVEPSRRRPSSGFWRTKAETLAPSSVAVAPVRGMRRSPPRSRDVALYPPLGCLGNGVCVDEKTSLQPRTRKAPTLAAQPGQPVRVEHEYARKGP